MGGHSLLGVAVIEAVPFFVAGAVTDWRTRTAPNVLWACIALLSLPRLFLATGPGPLAATVMMAALGVLLYVGGIGGADSKAIMAIGPFFPDPFTAMLVLGAAAIGTFPWFLVDKRAPFLIPLAASLTTFAVLVAL